MCSGLAIQQDLPQRCVKRQRYLPEVVNLAVNERLVLPLDVIDVLDVAGVEVLLHHEAQETVVRGVSCRQMEENVEIHKKIKKKHQKPHKNRAFKDLISQEELRIGENVEI